MKLHGDSLGCGLYCELAENFVGQFHDRGLVSMGELEEKVLQNPTLAQGHRCLGIRLLQDGRYRPAAASFRKSLELDPSDRQALLALACCLDREGSIQTAIELIEACLNADPEYCPALVALGYCRERLGDTSDAIAAYERAMKIAPHLKRIRTRFADLLHTSAGAPAPAERPCPTDPLVPQIS